MTPSADDPGADAPDTADDDAYDDPDSAEDAAMYTKFIHLSLRNCNHNRKINPNTKKTIKITRPPTLMPPGLMTQMPMTMMMLILTPCSISKTRK